MSWTPRQGDTPFEILGGAGVVDRISERFYDHMELLEPELAALHPCDEPGRVSRQSRENFRKFLHFWLGGPRTYLEERGHPMLRARHAPFPVDKRMRDAWLNSMRAALDELGIHGEMREFLDGRFAHVADFLRNVEEAD